MLISNSIIVFRDSIIVALHDPQFKNSSFYLILVLYAAPQFRLCILTDRFSFRLFKPPFLMSELCYDWPASGGLVRAAMSESC